MVSSIAMMPSQFGRWLKNFNKPSLPLCLVCALMTFAFLMLSSKTALFLAHGVQSRYSPSTTPGHQGANSGPVRPRHFQKAQPEYRPASNPSLFQTGQQQNQLLLVTQGRSGSSFTSNLISNASSVFYMFEPLFVLGHMLHSKSGANPSTVVLQLLETFLSCNFRHSNVTHLDNFQLRLSGPEMKRFFACVKTVSTGIRHIKCFFRLIEECRQKETIFAKTIRLSMLLAGELLQRMPNLKILYLVRDPRAVLRSQASVFGNFKWPQGLDSHAERHCRKITKDLATIERLSSLFPGRIRLIRYESGATDPVGYTKDIYQFVGLNFTQDTMTHVLGVTQGKGSAKQLHNPYGLVRSNTTEAANRWRSRVRYVNVKTIDKACTQVYSRFGYTEVTSVEHLHSDTPLFKPTFKQDV